MRITMRDTRLGESGSLLIAGNTYEVSVKFGSEMIGLRLAFDADKFLSPANSAAIPRMEVSSPYWYAYGGEAYLAPTVDTTGTTDTWAALTSLFNSGYSICNLPQGTFVPYQSVFYPAGVTIKGVSARGNGTVIQNHPSGTYHNKTSGTAQAAGVRGFLLMQAVVWDADAGNWDGALGNSAKVGHGGLTQLFISGSSMDVCPTDGILFSGAMKFTDLGCARTGTLIAKPGGYTDFVYIDRIQASQRPLVCCEADYATMDEFFASGNWLIDLPGLGDGFTINQVKPSYHGNDDDGASLGIRVGMSRGLKLSNVINGVTYLSGTAGFDVSSFHIEGGRIIVNAGSGVIRDSEVYLGREYNSGIFGPARIQWTDNDPGDSKYEGTVSNVNFVALANNREGWSGTIDTGLIGGATPAPDITVGTMYRLSVKNCHRKVGVTGALTRSQVGGIYVGSQATGVTKPDWLSYSHVLQKDAVIDGGVITRVDGTIPGITEGYFSGLSACFLSDYLGNGNRTYGWMSATGTYYYKAVLLNDPVRMIGRAPTAAEMSTSPTQYANVDGVKTGTETVCMRLSFGAITREQGWMVRFYRGTSTNSYNCYVDIPIVSMGAFYDDGRALNSYEWIGRTAGPIDSVNTPAIDGPLNFSDGILTTSATTFSNSTQIGKGSWKTGDRVYLDRTSYDSSTYGNSADQVHARLTTGSGHVYVTAITSITIASPAVVTQATHGLSDGMSVVFATTGALPTGLVAGTRYYIVNSTTTTFQVAATAGGAAINTSGTQSGTHTLVQDWAKMK